MPRCFDFVLSFRDILTVLKPWIYDLTVNTIELLVRKKYFNILVIIFIKKIYYVFGYSKIINLFLNKIIVFGKNGCELKLNKILSLTSVTAFDNLDLLSLSHVRIYALKKRDQLR